MTFDAEAAALEVLLLRASLPREIQPPYEPVHLVEEHRDASASEAVDYLAKQPKPIRCRARLQAGRLAISAVPPTSEERKFHDWLLTVPTSNLGGDLSRKVAGGRLRVKSGNDSVTVAVEAYEAWQRDYVRGGSFATVGPTELSNDDSSEARWEIGIGRTLPPVESYSLDRDESVLCDRCRQFLAVAVLRDRSGASTATTLLCEHCLQAEGARELARQLGIDGTMSDEEARRFFSELLESMHQDMQRDSSNNPKPEPPN